MTPAPRPEQHTPTARTVQEVLDLAARAERVDGVEALGAQTLLNLRDPSATVRHVFVRGDDLLGYAQVDESPSGVASAELVVSPEHRRRGVGAALLTAVRSGERPVAVWAHGNLPAAAALASRAGLRVVRELWQMAKDLTPADRAEVPQGLTVRPFVVGQDEQAWLTVNARAFADHPEQGRMSLPDLRAREQEEWFSAEDLLLAEQGDRLVASVWMKVAPGSDTGELYVLGVDPDAQGRGLGRLLTAMTLDHLAAKGLRRVVLYTAPTSTAAVRTYLAGGFATSRVDVQYG